MLIFLRLNNLKFSYFATAILSCSGFLFVVIIGGYSFILLLLTTFRRLSAAYSSGIVRVGHFLYVCGCWDTPSLHPWDADMFHY